MPACDTDTVEGTAPTAPAAMCTAAACSPRLEGRHYRSGALLGAGRQRSPVVVGHGGGGGAAVGIGGGVARAALLQGGPARQDAGSGGGRGRWRRKGQPGPYGASPAPHDGGGYSGGNAGRGGGGAYGMPGGPRSLPGATAAVRVLPPLQPGVRATHPGHHETYGGAGLGGDRGVPGRALAQSRAPAAAGGVRAQRRRPK
ncbi:hypothetical protein HXX76_003703 [Chlamydomonas incerta]|uniref:Uncharacterized protein n=1 Tax=Chlamydomonas incerta TaxID=51695 RepID=A0A835W847_CHLIN|nr:hypothetical protein HXX76_003703 [Chlamydomonas incerta]|eukprot:KAG2440849.1 hypothetical protein HXX76_003703 [Chlamydomonas incerta]